jgi:hypothetical protein
MEAIKYSLNLFSADAAVLARVRSLARKENAIDEASLREEKRILETSTSTAPAFNCNLLNVFEAIANKVKAKVGEVCETAAEAREKFKQGVFQQKFINLLEKKESNPFSRIALFISTFARVENFSQISGWIVRKLGEYKYKICVSITRLANITQLSRDTFVRFCKKFGFSFVEDERGAWTKTELMRSFNYMSPAKYFVLTYEGFSKMRKCFAYIDDEELRENVAKLERQSEACVREEEYRKQKEEKNRLNRLEKLRKLEKDRDDFIENLRNSPDRRSEAARRAREIEESEAQNRDFFERLMDTKAKENDAGMADKLEGARLERERERNNGA